MSKKLHYKDIYKDFKQVYPRLSQDAIRWQPEGYCTIRVSFSDGAFMIYDYAAKRGRYTCGPLISKNATITS